MDLPQPQDLLIRPGWLNAPGMLGFAPPPAWPWPQAPLAFVTNPISEHHRGPAQDRSARRFPGGILLHTGWPNPGIRTTIKNYAGRWARCDVPVWASLLAETPQGLDQMIRRLEDCENVQAVVLNLPPDCSTVEALRLIGAGQGELPLVVSLAPERLREEWIPMALESGISALAIAAPRGCLPAGLAKLQYGRLYGPGLFPVCLAAFERLKPCGLPIIAGGGIFQPAQVEALLARGAAAVQIDIALWKINQLV